MEVGVGDDEDGFLDVVEDDEFVVDAEEEVGEVAIVCWGGGEFFGFEVADGVVGGVTDGAADEGGEDGGGGESDALDGAEEIFEVFEGVGGGEVSSFGFRVSGFVFDGHLVAEGFDDGVGAGGEEGVAGDAFAADDGFEEEGVLGAGAFCEAFVGGDGGEVIGEEGAEDGDCDAAIGAGAAEFANGVEARDWNCSKEGVWTGGWGTGSSPRVGWENYTEGQGNGRMMSGTRWQYGSEGG